MDSFQDKIGKIRDFLFNEKRNPAPKVPPSDSPLCIFEDEDQSLPPSIPKKYEEKDIPKFPYISVSHNY